MKYFTVDINKCYDSIDTSKLIRIIEETPYIEDFYIIINYLRLYRNKRPLDKKQFFSAYFNVKERVRATPLSQDLLEITAEHKVPSINIYTAKQRSISRETVVENLQSLCEGSIINYRGSYWLQKVGIPQGLNVSGVLCSLYFSKLEENYVKVEEGLLMRHTDDYLYIGP